MNDELLKAESLLEIGQYYEAARRYGAAHRLDPLNPLPLIGRGNAMLAAGEYLSAAASLVQGFQRYPELSRFSFDLTTLIGGGEIVDIRRADIMRRLESRDDARLRFLLGYLEYYGGDQVGGMRNIERAAELDRGQSIISRFPAMLRKEGAAAASDGARPGAAGARDRPVAARARDAKGTLMRLSLAALLVLPTLLVLSGCSQRSGLTGQQARVIQASDADEVLAAAATLLRREFGRVHIDAEDRTIVTEPAAYDTTRESGTARDLYRGRSTMRRVAHFSVEKRGDATIARLRIDIERQDTERMRGFQPETTRISDSPAYTPIDRDAATTERQNTVWSFVRRDQRLERSLLAELQERFAPPAAAETAAEQPVTDQAGGNP